MTSVTPFRLVKRETLQDIHNATLDILGQRGIIFQSESCLQEFKKHGARVDGQIVYLKDKMVEEALQSAPSDFTWHARNPEKTIEVGVERNEIHVCLNNGPIYVQDLDGGRRLGMATDLVNLYKLAQQSSVCSIVGQIPVEPSDLAGPGRHLNILRLLLSHADKPLYGYVGESAELEQMFDLIRLAHGSGLEDNSLFENPRVAVSINPLSPLRYDKIPSETLLAYARLRQPIMVLTCAMSGVTAPVDPMGTVVLQNAEMLAGITLAQLISPGTPVIYSPASAVPNMRTASFVTGSPESNLINIVNIQLARELYKIPNRCMAGLTDAKVPDCQAGYETMQNYLMLAMSGMNMVNECFGILDGIMTVSYEKFIIDDEIMSRAARVVRGIEMFTQDYALEAIKEIGHGGSYLMHPSTMKYCRSLWTPEISTMDSYESWEKAGSMDVVRRANGKYKEILSKCPESLLEPDISRDMDTYIENLYTTRERESKRVVVAAPGSLM